MFGLDDQIAHLGTGQGIAVALILALLLGLRHATDPDHLTAVSTLALSEGGQQGVKRGRRLGLAWGCGHALTIVVLGLPVVLVSRALPEKAQQFAELGIGILIIALALRLLWRWQHGYLHVHRHEHDGVWHAHPHVHEHAHGPREHERAHDATHQHRHPADLGRTPRAAFGIGLMHGVGGSAGVSILLIGAISSPVGATAALLVFAAGTAISMSLLTGVFGGLLATPTAQRRFATLAPGFGTVALLFGAWYALGAAGAVPYIF